jgi:hypothetical protein
MRRAGCLREDVTDALPLGPKESSAGIVNLGGRGMLVVSVARQLGSGNSFGPYYAAPLKPSRGRKKALCVR